MSGARGNLEGHWRNAYDSVLRLQPRSDGAIEGVYRSVHTGNTGTFRVSGWTLREEPRTGLGRPLAFVIDWRALLPGESRDLPGLVSGFCGQWLDDERGPRLDLNHSLVVTATAGDPGIYIDRLVYEPTTAALQALGTVQLAEAADSAACGFWRDSGARVELRLRRDSGGVLRGTLAGLGGIWRLCGVAAGDSVALAGMHVGEGGGEGVCTLAGRLDGDGLWLCLQHGSATSVARRYLQTRTGALRLQRVAAPAN
jgi:Avidin family